MPFEVLFALLLILTVVTLLGHGIWLLLAALFRGLGGGSGASSAGAAGRGRAAGPLDDLWGFSRTVRHLRQWGWIDADEEARLHALGQRYQTRVLAKARPGVSPPATEPPPRPAEPPPLAANPLLPAATSDVAPPTAPAVPPTATGIAVPRHPLDPDPAPTMGVGAATAIKSPVVPSDAAPSAMQRPAWMPASSGPAASEVLRSFLAAHNIRWGELVAGLLIVVCSIGLVISLWSTLAATHRLLPAMVFLVGTAAIEAAGLYTLRRWRLRHTSRAVLLIATLLVPLSVVAGVGMAGTGADAVHLSDPLTIGFLLVGALVYGGAIWVSGVAMVRRHDAPWWTLAVLAPTALLPIVPAAVRTLGSQAGWLALLGSVATAAAMTMASRRGAWHSPPRRTVATAIRNRWLIALVGVYALAVLIAFLTLRGDGSLAATVPPAIAALPALVAMAAAGLAMRRDSRAATMSVVGGALAAVGGLLIAAVLPATLADPQWLIAWAVAVAGTALVMAVGLNLRWLMTLAALAGGLAVVMTAPLWLSGTPWQAGWMLWQRLLAGEAMVVACGLGVGLVLAASGCRIGGGRLPVFQSPLAVGGALWSMVAALQALLVGGFSWLPWMPMIDHASIAGWSDWQLAVIVLLIAGATSIAAARRTSRPRWMAPTLLAAGQSALLASLVIGAGWSRGGWLLNWSDWTAASAAAWGWIGLLAGYGLLWQIAAMVMANRGPLGRVVRRSRLRVDRLVCGVAGIGLIVGGAAALLQWMVDYHQRQPSSVVIGVLIPAVAMVLAGGALLVTVTEKRARTIEPATGRLPQEAGRITWLTDAAMLVPQAMLLWWLVRFSPATVTGMTIVGSGTLIGGLVAAILAWWGLRRCMNQATDLAANVRPRPTRLTQLGRSTQLARLVTLSGGWSGLAVMAVAGVLLKVDGAAALRTVPAAQAGGDVVIVALLVVAVWMTVVALVLAVASVVTARRSLGWLAAVLLPAAAVLAAAAVGSDRWQWLTAVGWAAVLAVATQRLWERMGGQARLRALAVAPREPAPAAPSAWPLAVIGLTQLAAAVSVVIAAGAIAAVWVAAPWAADVVDGWTLALIAATAALSTLRGASWLAGIRLGVLPVIAGSAGAIVAFACRWQGIAAGDGWRILLWIWLGTSLVAALHYVIGLAAGRRWPPLSGGWGRGTSRSRAGGVAARWDWNLAVVLAGVVAALGYTPRVVGDAAVWASITACGTLGALALAAAWRSRSASAGRRPWVAAEAVALGAASAAVPLLGWRTSAQLDAQWSAAALVVWLFGWAVAWRLALPSRETERLPQADSLIVWLGMVPLVWLPGAGMLAERGSLVPLIVGVVVAAAVALTAPLRVERRGQTAAAYLALLCVVLGVGAVVQRMIVIDGDLRVSLLMVSVAAVASLAGWGWPLRRTLRRAMQRSRLRWSDDGDRGAEAEFAFCVLATTAGMIAVTVVALMGDWDAIARYLAVGAVGLCGWAVSGVASRQPADALRTVTVLVFCVALALAAVAGPAATAHGELVIVMRLLVVGVLLVPVNLWLAARVLRLPLQQWQRPLRAGAMAGAALAVASLLLMLGVEAAVRDSEGIADLPVVSVAGVAVVLAALSALCLIPAVSPRVAKMGRVLPDLTDTQRKGLIYAAQLLAALTWLHVFLCRPDWGMIGLRPYWPLLVMGLAFLSAAVTEWARRRDDRVLADVLRQTSLYLPLIPVIGFWLSGARIDWAFAEGRLPYAALLAAGALFYAGLAMLWRRDHVPRVIGVVLGNAALWVALAQTPGWEFVRHPQLWLIPPAVCVLVAVHWERRRLDPAVATAIRYAAALLIYISSTADMLLQQVGTTIGGPIMLVSLALAGLAAGVVLRVRAFLYLGTTFVLIGVLSMVWHAQQAIDQVWPWWVFGITSGVLLLAGLMALEKNKGKLKELSDRLAGWEG